MKLVSPGGEHPQLLLDRGSYRIGSDPKAQVLGGVQARLVAMQHAATGPADARTQAAVIAGTAVSCQANRNR